MGKLGRPSEQHLPRRSRADIRLCREVREAAQAQGITRAELAAAWGVAENTVTNVLRGHTRFRPHHRALLNEWLRTVHTQ